MKSIGCLRCRRWRWIVKAVGFVRQKQAVGKMSQPLPGRRRAVNSIAVQHQPLPSLLSSALSPLLLTPASQTSLLRPEGFSLCRRCYSTLHPEL